MDWTIQDYAHANHNPIAIVNGNDSTAPIYIQAKAGVPVKLDAGKSHDPDGQSLSFHWFHYREAGLADGNLATISLSNADRSTATVTATSTCSPTWLPLISCRWAGVAHIILAVTDTGSPQLTTYRRIILHISQANP